MVLADNGAGADTDPNSDLLSVTAVNGEAGDVGVAITLGSGASLTVESNGTFTYDPTVALDVLAAGDSLEDGFTYTVSDPLGEFDDAEVSVTVGGLNDDPVAGDDFDGTDEDDALLVDVLVNDSDIDGDEFEIDSFTQPADGTVTQIGEALLFIPDDDVFGLDTFTYTIVDGNGGSATATVSITVNPMNDDPVASDDVAETDEDTPISIDVLDNDVDVDGDDLDVQSFSQGASGTVSEVAGELLYAPDADTNGEDEFTYTVSDGNGGTDTATVTVTVNAIPDPPVAQDDEIAANEDDESVDGSLFDDNGNGPDFDADGDELTITFVDGGPIGGSVSVPLSNGDVDLDSDGDFTFTPDAGLNTLPLGAEVSDTFTYTISDGGSTDDAIVEVILIGENDDPVAGDDGGYVTDEETSFDIEDLLDNDDDVDTGDELEIVGVDATSLEGAAVSINEDGSIAYDPVGALDDVAAGDSVEDTFSYTVSDGNGGTDTATVTVTVNGVNDAPVAVDDDATIDEDGTELIVDVLANDDDVDGDDLDIDELVLDGTIGIVTALPDGTIRYNPFGRFEALAAGETVVDSFGYEIVDGNGASDSATVSVTITGVNDAPVADDDTATVDEDGFVVIDVLDNDDDVDASDVLTPSVTDGPSNGAAEVNEDGTITYTPDANFAGVDSFTYEVDDGNGGTDTALVTVTIGGENDEPVAVDDTAAADEGDGPALVDVLDNDSDVDEDTLTVTAVDDLGTTGAVTLTDGDVAYSPDGQFEGLADGEEATDSFEYSISDGNGGTDSATVTVTITGENDAPDAVDDDEESTDEDTAFDVAVLGNDTDVDVSDVLNVTAVDDTGTVGTVTLVDGTVNYDPAGAFEALGAGDSATDTFTYTVSDGNGGSDTATVTVTVDGVNDAPDAVDDDEESTDEDTAFDVAVIGNDTDAEDDELTVTAVDDTGTVGTVTLVDGTVNYDPAGAFEALGAGDSATDTFTYTVSDGNGGSDTATVTVTVDGVNDAPDAGDDDVDVTEDDGAASVDVLANDDDVEGDDVTVTAVDDTGTVGTVTLVDGVVGYDPAGAFESLAAGEDTTDTFGYSVSDGNGGSDSATVTVTVSGVNDAPDAVDDEVSTDEDTPVDIDVLANDDDVDASDELTVSITADPADGTAVANEDGSVTYTPDENFFGEDSFTYQVDDGNGGLDTAAVTVTVDPINDDPLAVDDSAETDEDTATDIDVLDNDSDVDEDSLSVTIDADPSDGTAEVNEDGSITYTPDEDFFGEDSFTYQVDDGNGGFDTATVTVTVNAVNDDPVALDDSGVGFELDDGAPSFVTADVLANDSDIDGGALSVTILDLSGTQGTVTYLGDGTFLYENTEGLGVGAEDSWSYTVSDGNGGTDTATVTITIVAAD